MRYSKPQLFSLTEGTSTGNCADGSGAAKDSSCSVGGDVALSVCSAGSAASFICQSGTAASAIGCITGDGDATGCSVGTAATGPPPLPPCVTGVFVT